MRVGFIQNDPVFGSVRHNLDAALEILSGMQADLVVLPELFATGYQFTGPEEARDLGEPIPGGPTTEALIEAARANRQFLVAGLPEIDEGIVYNSAVIVGPEGYVGKYRKAHLFDTEKEVFQPGNLPLKVFDLGGVRVGVMICFDWRFPETARVLALQGAEIIAHPANLVLAHCPQAMITRCLENRVFAITADRVGKEERVPGHALRFMGQSQVVDPDGNVLYRASIERPENHVIEIDPEQSRNKYLNPRNQLFEDRREDLYRID
ncbi:MAG: acyltransferase [Nitrospinae bacterium CG11_big_fil_rev_8_21_14_0_20_56_8]|nr:MAG: acyltransferase [Nitrospinae bacterium CG11_big_fil_rev_8_21_14_0_20_56_8]